LRGKQKRRNPGAKTASVKTQPPMQALRSSRTEFLSGCYFRSHPLDIQARHPWFPYCPPPAPWGGRQEFNSCVEAGLCYIWAKYATGETFSVLGER